MTSDIVLWVGLSCPKCKPFKAMVDKACSKLGLNYRIKTLTDETLTEALMQQVATVPTLLIDGEPCFIREVDYEDLIDTLDEYLRWRENGACSE